MVRRNIDIQRDRLAELCRRHRIRRLSLFGSALRDDFAPDSNVDLLVEFEPGYSPGWDIIHVEKDLSRLFDRRTVDIVNPKFLNLRLKRRILESAVLEYESDDVAERR